MSIYLGNEKILAPEPFFSAYLSVLNSSVLLPRMWVRYDHEFTKEQLHDLMDAVENIPQFLYSYGGWYNEDNMYKNIERYDEKWATPKGDTGSSLISVYQSVIKHHSKKTNQKN